jgi:hypothetical protein
MTKALAIQIAINAPRTITPAHFNNDRRPDKTLILTYRISNIRAIKLDRFIVSAWLPAMAGYVYVLCCADGRLYYGSTNDLRGCLDQHRAGKVRSAKWRLPANLLYHERFQTLEQAR